MSALAKSLPGDVLPMPIREVTERLSVREFLLLCDGIDKKLGKKIAAITQLGQQSSHSGNKFLVGERIEGGVKFDVIDILRRGKELTVIVDLPNDYGFMEVKFE